MTSPSPAPADSRAHNLAVNHFDTGGWHVTTCEEREATSRITVTDDRGLLRFAVADADEVDAETVITHIDSKGIADGLERAANAVGGPVSFAGVEWRLNALTAWRAGDAEIWARKAGSWSQILSDDETLPHLGADPTAYVRVHAAEEIIVAGSGAHLDADRARDIGAWISSGLHESTADHWDVTVIWARRNVI